MNSKIFTNTSIILLFLFLSACSEEKKDNTTDILPGLWKLSEKVTDSQPVNLEECERQSTLDFKKNNLVTIYNGCTETSVNSGWSYRNEMLNIAVHLPAGYYIDLLDAVTLRISRYDLTEEGAKTITTLTYLRQ